MQYLSGLDNLFLHQESPTQHMHVAGLGIYDPSTAPHGRVRFKSILDFFLQRMLDQPVFRRRLVRNALVPDRPVWVVDSTVDVEYHVRHLALPHPGDWRQLMIQIARIHSRPLDMTRPPWEAYVIEGLDKVPGLPAGSFALYIKVHHCAIDGELGAQLMGSLHTLSPELDRSRKRAQRTIIADREPGTLELLANAVANRSRRLLGLGSLAVSLRGYAVTAIRDLDWSMLGRGLDRLGSSSRGGAAADAGRPDTRFNGKIGPHRVLDAVGLDLASCSRIRQNVEGVTINDIFLAVVGGALKQYIAEKDGAPSGSLKGTMPMTLRGDDKSGAGNQIAQVYYSLRTDIDQPVERLLAINEGTASVKAATKAGLGPDIQMRLLEVLPASLVATLLTKELGDKANVNVSNVRGPGRPMYLAGAKLERFIPFSLIFDGCGLNVTGFSYNGVLWVALTCCRTMMPDPDRFAACLTTSFTELVEASKRHASRRRAAGPRRVSKSRRKKRSLLAASGVANPKRHG